MKVKNQQNLQTLKTELSKVETQEHEYNKTTAELEQLAPSVKPQLEKVKTQVDHRFSLERAALEAKIKALETPSTGGSHGGTHTPPATPPPSQHPNVHLSGADTSHWQSSTTFEQSIKGSQFSAVKATDGTGYVDPSFKSRWNELGKKIDAGQMKLRVAYQFMQPGDGTAQAKHFLKTLGISGPLQPGTRLALDWEASALRDPKALHDAANYIHQVTGIWPMVYTSASEVSRAKAAVPHAPIWEAKWGGSLPNDNSQFVQTSDGPGFDHDIFRGDLNDLEKFAGWK